MKLSGFRKTGHMPTLVAAFLYFDVSFMARFAHEVGLLTGLVGAAGGIGGFFLPSMLGAVNDLTGQYGPGLLACSVLLLAGAAVLLHLGTQWSTRWSKQSLERAGVFSYRRWLTAEVEEIAA